MSPRISSPARPGETRFAGGSEDDQLDGAGDNDNLQGQSGHDMLIGGAGDDVLNGGRGDDVMDGGAGKDVFLPGGDTDTITTGTGRDIISIDEDDGTVILTDFTRGEDKINVKFLGDNAARLSDLSFAVIGNDTHVTYGATTLIFQNNTSISGSDFRLAGQTGTGGNNVLTGTEFDDNIYGRNGDDTLNGLEGADYILGEGGMDIIDGGAGRDNLHGGRQDDQIFGGEGNDFLNGGLDDDRLEGGLNNDTLLGGGGNDTFVFTQQGGRDKVRDFTQGEDLLDVADLGITSQADFDSMGPVSGGYELVSGDVTIFLQGFSGTLTDADFVFANTVPIANDDTFGNSAESEAFAPITGDIQVNTETSDAQQYSSVAALEGGGFVVTWSGREEGFWGWDVYAQLYDGSGNALGSEFRVNSHTPNDQRSSSVAPLEDGGFIVSWFSREQDGTSFSIYAQRFNSLGQTVGDEFRVNSFMENGQDRSDVTILKDGGLIITWESSNQDGSSSGIYAQRYDSTGAPIGGEFQVNTETNDGQKYTSSTALEDGGFVITWTSAKQDGSGEGIYAQRYDSAGGAVGEEFQVNSFTRDWQIFSSVAGLNDGGFVITWSSRYQDGSGYGIYAQRYDSAGQATGGEFLVNSFTSLDQLYSNITALEDGGFVITWTSYGLDGSDWGIYAQRYDSSGMVVGEETRLNEITRGSQSFHTELSGKQTAVLADGTLVSTWSGFGNEEVFVRLFDLPEGAATDEDTPLIIDAETLIANDSDANGDMLVVSAVEETSSNGASVTLNADGDIVYDPTSAMAIQVLNEGETLQDTFIYTISDGNGGTDTANATIFISGRQLGYNAESEAFVPITGDIQVNTETSDAQQYSSVAALGRWWICCYMVWSRGRVLGVGCLCPAL